MPAKSSPLPQRRAGVRGMLRSMNLSQCRAPVAISVSIQPGTMALERTP
jgi:hypothetical protein